MSLSNGALQRDILAVNNPEVKVDLINFIYSYIEGQALKLGLSVLFQGLVI